MDEIIAQPGYMDLMPLALDKAFAMRARLKYSCDMLLLELGTPIEGQVLEGKEKDAALHILKEGTDHRDILHMYISKCLSSVDNASRKNFEMFDEMYQALEDADTVLCHMLDVNKEIGRRHHMMRIKEDIPDFIKAIVLRQQQSMDRDED